MRYWLTAMEPEVIMEGRQIGITSSGWRHDECTGYKLYYILGVA